MSQDSPPESLQDLAFRLLVAIKEKTERSEEPVLVTQLSASLGVGKEDTKAAYQYLADKHLIKTYSSRFQARINAAGHDAIQDAMRDTESRKMQSDVGARQGSKIFIGHGRSMVWRDLKDFITERLKLPHDEFNAEPVAGISNTERLTAMMRDATFAFLVLTAEDEQPDGRKQARMNVIHEVGLFQGRLGFNRAIVLLEDGCEEFSNIAGLGQIRFPKGQISAKFEEIRRVLERESIVGA